LVQISSNFTNTHLNKRGLRSESWCINTDRGIGYEWSTNKVWVIVVLYEGRVYKSGEIYSCVIILI